MSKEKMIASILSKYGCFPSVAGMLVRVKDASVAPEAKELDKHIRALTKSLNTVESKEGKQFYQNKIEEFGKAKATLTPVYEIFESPITHQAYKKWDSLVVGINPESRSSVVFTPKLTKSKAVAMRGNEITILLHAWLRSRRSIPSITPSSDFTKMITECLCISTSTAVEYLGSNGHRINSLKSKKISWSAD